MVEATIPISFRVTEQQKQLLQRCAKFHQRTLGGEIRFAVQEYLEQLEKTERKENDGQAT